MESGKLAPATIEVGKRYEILLVTNLLIDVEIVSKADILGEIFFRTKNLSAGEDDHPYAWMAFRHVVIFERVPEEGN